jgi:hypothetical protein
VIEWTRLAIGARCGGCGRELEKGDPVLVRRISTMTRRFIRCTTCEGPAPPDLPALIVTRSAYEPINLTRFGILPMDFSRKDPHR